MRTLGNIIWIIAGGLLLTLGWALVGLICCITIVGIPLGRQAFKMSELTLAPFGREVEYGGGTTSFIVNIIWIVLFGWEMALGYVIAGIVNCVTVIGIPFGLQAFKLAKLALMPFGAKIR